MQSLKLRISATTFLFLVITVIFGTVVPVYAQQSKLVNLEDVAQKLDESKLSKYKPLIKQVSFDKVLKGNTVVQTQNGPQTIQEAEGIISIIAGPTASRNDSKLVTYQAQGLPKGSIIVPQVDFSRGPLMLQAFFVGEDLDNFFLTLWEGNFNAFQPGSFSFRVTIFSPNGDISVLFAPVGSSQVELSQFQFINSARQVGGNVSVETNQSLSFPRALINFTFIPQDLVSSGGFNGSEIKISLERLQLATFLPEGNIFVTIKDSFICDTIVFRYRRPTQTTSN
jgi:hypothetical protein